MDHKVCATGAALLLMLVVPNTAQAGEPEIDGLWTGQVTQVDRPPHYGIVLNLKGRKGSSYYPDLDCRGELTLFAVTEGYAFYRETIVDGGVGDRAPGGCIDGTIAVARAGARLAWSWFGVYEGEPEFAYATLEIK